METILDQELTQLVRISWYVLITVGILLVMILYKVLSLLSTLVQFVTVAQYEASPAIRNLRMTTEHVEALTFKARSSVESVEQGIEATKPLVEKGAQKVKNAADNILSGVGSVAGGFLKSLVSSKK